MSHLPHQQVWDAPPTPPLSPSDVEKPLPAAPAATAACGRTPAAVMRELAALSASGGVPAKAAEAARLGQSLLRSAAQLLALEGAHAALSADFDAKMNAWGSAIYVSSPKEVEEARAAALGSMEPLREAVAAVDAACAAWGALDALRGGPVAQLAEFVGEAPGGAQGPSPFIDSLTKHLNGLSSAPQSTSAPFQAQGGQLGPFPFHTLLAGTQPPSVLLRHAAPGPQHPIFGGVPLVEPRQAPSLTLQSLGGDELGMVTPVAEGGPGLAEGLDWTTVLGVAATGAPAHSGYEAGGDPLSGLTLMLSQRGHPPQLDPWHPVQHREEDMHRGMGWEEAEYADVLCALGRDSEDDSGGCAPRRGPHRGSSGGGGTTPTSSSGFVPSGTSTGEDTSGSQGPLSCWERLAVAVRAFMASPAAAAPLPCADVTGVTRHKRTRKFEAHVWADKRQSYLGGYDSQAAAARAHGKRGEGEHIVRY